MSGDRVGFGRRLLGWLRAIFWDERLRRLRTLWRLLIFLGVRWLLNNGLSRMGMLLGLYRHNPVLVSVSIRTVATLGAALICLLWLDRRKLACLGLPPSRTNWAEFGYGLALGALVMSAVFGAALALGWAQVKGTWVSYRGLSSLLVPLGIWLLVGIEEEVFARGYLLLNLAEGLHGRRVGARGAVVLAWLLTSVYFGILHADNPNATWQSTVALMAAGLFLGLGVVLTGRLGLAIGLHITWNLFEGTVYGFQVSGFDVSPFKVWRTAITGPALWMGGAFGPEAGLLGWLALLLGAALILIVMRVRQGRVTIAASLAEAASVEGAQ